MAPAVRELLAMLQLSPDDISGFALVDDEFRAIKKAFFQRALDTHPDKGGDAAEFRKVSYAFNVMRELFEAHEIESFARDADRPVKPAHDEDAEAGEPGPTFSWEFYATVEKSTIPPYRVEIARTGRSACNQQGSRRKCSEGRQFIKQGEPRIGWMQETTGDYGRWCHLECWRVPSKVYLGLPDPETASEDEVEAALMGMDEIAMCGFAELPPDKRRLVTRHAMNKENWAKLTRSLPQVSRREREASEPDDVGEALETKKDPDSAVARRREQKSRYAPPVPGQAGCRPDALKGLKVVLTGTFPEVGGGMGLTLGKERTKAIVEAFGGRVMSSASSRTDMLVVGHDPGFGSVLKARTHGTPMLSLPELSKLLAGHMSLDDAAKRRMRIEHFSTGFRGQNLAKKASPEDLAIAKGDAPPRQIAGGGRKRAITKGSRTARPKADGTRGSRRAQGTDRDGTAAAEEEGSNGGSAAKRRARARSGGRGADAKASSAA